MRKRNRSDLLLVEILIAVLFFMLSLTVLVQVFAYSRNLTVRARAKTEALAAAQNVADGIIAAEDPEAALTQMEFTCSHGVWTRNYGEFSLLASGEDSPREAGSLWEGEVKACYNSSDSLQERTEADVLFALPCVRYRGD